MKGRIHPYRTPKCLWESSQSKHCCDQEPPSSRQLHQETQSPLWSQAPWKGSTPAPSSSSGGCPCALRLAANPSWFPAKPPCAPQLRCPRCQGSWLTTGGEGVKKSKQGGWASARREAGSPSHINVSGSAWAHQVGIYTVKPKLCLRFPVRLSSHLTVHSPHGRKGQCNCFLPPPGF